MARKYSARTAQRQYVTVFESEGRKWGERCIAVTLLDAELLAATEARARNLRVVSIVVNNEFELDHLREVAKHFAA
ncbi:MAG TPA: hypothetical protein VM621_05075 [Luteibacter sp.]|uniref:hypothetical protein n=1 Tax=Luteibacter sp. TaxID=1886636 RepID=UPI002BCED64A|nr:hypothetical protein [Luteibacter sp.]HVI54410.1 hypothetical protein [Luteibacter sp.]